MKTKNSPNNDKKTLWFDPHTKDGNDRPDQISIDSTTVSAKTVKKKLKKKKGSPTKKIKKWVPPIIINLLSKPTYLIHRHSLWRILWHRKEARLESFNWWEWLVWHHMEWPPSWQWKAHKDVELSENQSFPRHVSNLSQELSGKEPEENGEFL